MTTLNDYIALEADYKRLQEKQRHILQWLRMQAAAEKEPKAKAAFVGAHNAVLSIIESRADQQKRKSRENIGH